MKLTIDVLKKITRSVANTKTEELGCDECFDELDRFVEMKLEGKNAVEALPLVQDHLERCNNCYEEFEALLDALNEMA
jgi:protein-arginine kinase activator protein McsA